jgi:toluene monooxygenase system ferredoxin subunit
MASARVGKLCDLWVGDMRAVCAGTTRILVVRTTGGVEAYVDRCPHLGLPLSLGRLDGDVLTCSAHHWSYDLCSGRGVNPSTVSLQGVPVRIVEGEVFVDLEEAPA